MYAVMAHGGRQYRVVPGEIVRLGRIVGSSGDAVEFADLRLVEADGEDRFGKALAGAKVVGTVVRHDRAPKVIIFKKKRCKQYRRTRGHRQDFTEVRIERIG